MGLGIRSVADGTQATLTRQYSMSRVDGRAAAGVDRVEQNDPAVPAGSEGQRLREDGGGWRGRLEPSTPDPPHAGSLAPSRTPDHTAGAEAGVDLLEAASLPL